MFQFCIFSNCFLFVNMTATGVATLLGRQLFSIRVPQRCSPLAVWTQLRNKSDATDVGWDYETERKTFSLKAPEYYNFARDVVDKWAEKEKVIIIASKVRKGQRSATFIYLTFINYSNALQMQSEV